MSGGAVTRAGLAVFRRLPRAVRLGAITVGSTPYHVGALCVVTRPSDGAVLLVRHTYRSRWGLPGGLARRGERADDAAVRETAEEVGLTVRLLGDPVVVVEPRDRRVDVTYRAVPADPQDPDGARARPTSAEIAECRWWPARALPPLQSEAAGAIISLDRQGGPAGWVPVGPDTDGAAS